MRQFLFKWRGWIIAPYAVIILFIAKPTFLYYVIGGAIAILGEMLRMWAVGYAGITTRSNKITAPYLTTAGPYAYVRNPIYLGNIITALGFAIMAIGGLNLIYKIIIIAFTLAFYLTIYFLIITKEEEYLKEVFKEEYTDYLNKVNRLLPSFKPYDKAKGKFNLSYIWLAESQTLIYFALIFFVFTLKLYLK